MILNYNRVLGGARIRQVRVQPDSCAKGVRDLYKDSIKWCYGALTEAYEHKTGDELDDPSPPPPHPPLPSLTALPSLTTLPLFPSTPSTLPPFPSTPLHSFHYRFVPPLVLPPPPCLSRCLSRCLSLPPFTPPSRPPSVPVSRPPSVPVSALLCSHRLWARAERRTSRTGIFLPHCRAHVHPVYRPALGSARHRIQHHLRDQLQPILPGQVSPGRPPAQGAMQR
jgi:hypothetical protein